MKISSLCCLVCNVGVELINHLFFSCSFAVEVHNKVMLWLGIDSLILFCYSDWVECLSKLQISKLYKEFLDATFSCYVVACMVVS